MSDTFLHKVYHIFFTKNGEVNLNIPIKLRWKWLNKCNRHNYEKDIDRASLASQRDKESRRDMQQQIKDL